MEDRHRIIVHGCKNRAETTRPLASPLGAEPSTVAKPGCCLAQVDRQLPGVEAGVLDQAAADRGLGPRAEPVAGALGDVAPSESASPGHRQERSELARRPTARSCQQMASELDRDRTRLK
jgi:hypothetical protein